MGGGVVGLVVAVVDGELVVEEEGARWGVWLVGEGVGRMVVGEGWAEYLRDERVEWVVEWLSSMGVLWLISASHDISCGRYCIDDTLFGNLDLLEASNCSVTGSCSSASLNVRSGGDSLDSGVCG